MNQQLEIHLNGDTCKVIEGAAKRTYFSTPEAVGLALLRIDTSTVAAANLKWTDFLASNGVAFGAMGNKVLTLFVTPTKQRTISYAGVPTRQFLVNLPPMLYAVCMTGGRFSNAKIYIINPVQVNKLSITGTNNTLATFPYGNVYSDGRVCWGSTKVSEITRPQDVEEAFFGSTFNGDLWYMGGSGGLPAMVEATKGVLTLPSSFPKSVAGVAAEITR